MPSSCAQPGCPAANLPPPQTPADIKALKEDVEEFATKFPTVGFEKATMRYKN